MIIFLVDKEEGALVHCVIGLVLGVEDGDFFVSEALGFLDNEKIEKTTNKGDATTDTKQGSTTDVISCTLIYGSLWPKGFDQIICEIGY